MKIISLNIWGGRCGNEKLQDFFKKYKDVDIFALQEVYNGATKPVVEDKGDQLSIYTDIQKTLSEHVGYFKPVKQGYGIAMFVKKSIPVLNEGDILIYEVLNYVTGANHSRNLQYVEVEVNNTKYTVANVHALWNGQGKGDSENRLIQSDIILNFLKGVKTPYILTGDLNLRPDTESLKKFENFGLRNLIKEYGITSTRTTLYTKPEKFGDYTFVSDGIKVKNFQILPEEVSDHVAMFMELE